MNSEQQINNLKLFNEKAAKLQSCSFTQKAFNQETGVSILIKNEEQPLCKIERRGPDDEAIDAFVLTFRFFIQNNEKSSFGNMALTYEKLLISEENNLKFKEAYNHINDMLDSKSFFNVDGRVLTNRHILDTFIYGGLSHANENKKKEYDLWILNPFTNQYLTNEFVYILSNILKVIFFMRDLNNVIIEELKKNN
jgi:hypothetical protein